MVHMGMEDMVDMDMVDMDMVDIDMADMGMAEMEKSTGPLLSHAKNT